jgi:hypothetical protein
MDMSSEEVQYLFERKGKQNERLQWMHANFKYWFWVIRSIGGYDRILLCSEGSVAPSKSWQYQYTLNSHFREFFI